MSEWGNADCPGVALCTGRKKQKLSGVVFIGDHCEERPEQLLALAETLGTRSLPLFIFHECADHDAWSLQAKPLFERMAKLSGGVYVEFKPDSGAVLKELLSGIAALSVGGVKAVERMALPTTSEGRQLRGTIAAWLREMGSTNICASNGENAGSRKERNHG